MQKFVICAVFFDKFVPYFYENRATLLWFVREMPGYGIVMHLAKSAAIFAKRATIR